MARSRIAHREIVEYVGSLTDLHGPISVVSRGARLRLRSACGLTLHDVRPTSVRALAVPALTRHRADALLMLFNRSRATVPMAARTWLIAQKLAHVDEQDGGRLALTTLGFELAGALPRYY